MLPPRLSSLLALRPSSLCPSPSMLAVSPEALAGHFQMHQIKKTVAEKVSVVITNSSRSIMVPSWVGGSCSSRSPSHAIRMPHGIGRRRRQAKDVEANEYSAEFCGQGARRGEESCQAERMRPETTLTALSTAWTGGLEPATRYSGRGKWIGRAGIEPAARWPSFMSIPTMMYL